MRWIFWFLLLCNLLAFGWRFWPGSVSAPRVPESSRKPKPAPPPGPVGRSLCVMAGAFKDTADAQQFMDRLAVLDVEAFIHPVDLSAGEGYWVFLEPFANREVARRRLAELQARGIDSYIIPKGELENGISLGVFTRLDLAQARLNEVRKLDTSAKMQPIERSYREIWVMLGEGEEHKLAEAVWLDLLRENLSLQQRQNFCSAVASAKKFH
jgi:cell division septation protein DedD